MNADALANSLWEAIRGPIITFGLMNAIGGFIVGGMCAMIWGKQ